MSATTYRPTKSARTYRHPIHVGGRNLYERIRLLCNNEYGIWYVSFIITHSLTAFIDVKHFPEHHWLTEGQAIDSAIEKFCTATNRSNLTLIELS